MLLLAGLASLAAASLAPPPEGLVLRAERARTPIVLDGHLDEGAWQEAPAASGFLQRDPNQGDRERHG